MRMKIALGLLGLMIGVLAACDNSTKVKTREVELPPVPHHAYVFEDGVLVAYELSSGTRTASNIAYSGHVNDPQILADGTLLANLRDTNEVLVVDTRTMTEIARFPSTLQDVAEPPVRPVHTYISPRHNGRQYLVSLNDGPQSGNTADRNSALFVDINPDSPTYLQPVGECPCGVGHHKLGFSTTTERVLITNIADPDNVMTIYDYSDISNIAVVMTITGQDLVNAGVTPAVGPPLTAGSFRPHGSASSKRSGMVYTNLTATGDIIAVDIDAPVPTFTVIPTNGTGSGYTSTSSNGRFVYSVQATPREGNGGVDNQIGQLAVIDADTDTLVAEVPLLYEGPGSTAPIAGTPQEGVRPSMIWKTLDGGTMFIALAGAHGDPNSSFQRVLALDMTVPGLPVQLDSIVVGTSSGHGSGAFTGSGQYLVIANTGETSLTLVNTTTHATTTYPTIGQPGRLVTWGTAEGPSSQSSPSGTGG
jgi:hypothetical protein